MSHDLLVIGSKVSREAKAKDTLRACPPRFGGSNTEGSLLPRPRILLDVGIDAVICRGAMEFNRRSSRSFMVYSFCDGCPGPDPVACLHCNSNANGVDLVEALNSLQSHLLLASTA